MPDTNNKPILIWDGECGFCEYSKNRLHRMDGKNRFVDVTNYEFTSGDLDNKSKAELDARTRREVLLQLPDGKILGGADAILTLLSIIRTPWFYKTLKSPPFIYPARWVYRWIANHRLLVSKWLKIDSTCAIRR